MEASAPNATDRRSTEEHLCAVLSGPLQLYAMRHLGADDRARDLVQDVLIAVLAAHREGKLDDDESAGRYALAAARNMIWDDRRKRTRRKRITAEKIAPVVVTAAVPAPLESMALWACLGAVTERVRQVLNLTFYRGWSTDEIAARLSVTAGNVRIIRHKGIKQLRECLGVRP